MNILRLPTLALVTGCLLLASGCAAQKKSHSMSACPREAVAVLHPTEGNDVSGVVRFTMVDGGMRVVADIRGLEPGSRHGFHIHQFGDCTAADATSAGGHYNPEGHDHGLPHARSRHAGDLGNVTAGEKGNALYQVIVRNVTVCPVVGRGVILHAKADDGGQPTGNAGARIAGGVIGIANPEAME